MFDSHAHINDSAFDADREAVIRQCFESGIVGWVEVGTSLEESKKAIALAETYPHIFASVGVHPHELRNMNEEDWLDFEELLNRSSVIARSASDEAILSDTNRLLLPQRRDRNDKICAIGEVGLDFSRVVIPDTIGDPGDAPPAGGVDSRIRGNDSKTAEIAFQETMLRKFIALAQEKRLPIIFHVRSSTPGLSAEASAKADVFPADAHDALIRILKTYSDEDRPKGVIHTFSGNLHQAQEYISLGMMISFSGVLTFKKSDELREIAKTIPLESILIETDCPYLTPEPHRGKRNDPSYIKYVINTIANVRNIPEEEIANITHNNAKKLFNI